MKRANIIKAALFILIVIGVTAFSFPAQKNQNKKIDITGTWKLDSFRYGGEAFPFTRATSLRSQIKLVSGNSFMWARFDSVSRKITASAGGKYTLEGDNYSESIDYGYEMDSYLGTVSKFKITVSEGMFFMTGYLNSGLKVEEIWRKVE